MLITISNTNLTKINFATGDAGIKIPVHMFNEQERYVAKITYGQVICILSTLDHTHNCVFKAYMPLAEPYTCSLLYLLATLFRTIAVHKPSTSHPSSSEVYIVCKYYYGIDTDLLTSLLHNLDTFNVDSSLIPENQIDTTFLKELISCSDMFTNNQIASIRRSLYYRYNYYDDYNIQTQIANNPLYHIQLTEDRNNLQEVREYIESRQFKLLCVKRILALLKINRFIVNVVLHRYYVTDEPINSSI